MRTALIGKFENGVMVEARPTKILAERCNDGLKEILVSPPETNSRVFRFQRNTRVRIHQPKIMDPFEKNSVFVSKTANSGEGLFARRNIETNEVVAYYSGVILKTEEINQIRFNGASNQTGYER